MTFHLSFNLGRWAAPHQWRNCWRQHPRHTPTEPRKGIASSFPGVPLQTLDQCCRVCSISDLTSSQSSSPPRRRNPRISKGHGDSWSHRNHFCPAFNTTQPAHHTPSGQIIGLLYTLKPTTYQRYYVNFQSCMLSVGYFGGFNPHTAQFSIRLD